MKTNRTLKTVLITLLIILISIISFAGLFVQDKNTMKNLVEDYKLGMDLTGKRVITLEVDNSKKTIFYDKDGKIVSEEQKNGKTEEVLVNNKESLTKENYLQTKKILEKRFDSLKVAEYHIRQDESTGKMTIELAEDSLTNFATQYASIAGRVTIQDDKGNILLDNSNIKDAKAGYATQSDGTVKVYINIQFNKDSVEKLREISNKYVVVKDEEGKDISEKVNIKIDEDTLLSTAFGEEITNGILSLSIGQASTSSSLLRTYIQEASDIALLINSGNFPVVYKMTQNRYVKSDITPENIMAVSLAVSAIIFVALIFVSIKYKKNGLLASISHIGYVAALLLVLRYANVMITMEGIFGILISIVLNFAFTIYLLNIIKNGAAEETIEKLYNKFELSMLWILLPIIFVIITLCTSAWLPIVSFGTTMVWGVALILLYNILVTRTLLMINKKK